MQLDRQAQRPARSKTRAICAGRRRCPRRTRPPHRPAPRHARLQRGQADLVDIGVGAALVFGQAPHGRRGKLVRPAPGAPGATRAGDAQHLQFGLDVEPVARLDLDRADALGDQRVDALERAGQQIGLGGGPRVADTVETMPPPARATSS
jgi:hypothetical protein